MRKRASRAKRGATRKPSGTKRVAASASSSSADDVDAFLRASKHPLRSELDLVRRIMLDASPRISEGVKWNAPSFRVGETWFATLNGPRHTEHVMLVLHAGAKAKGLALEDEIADPHGLLKWLGAERALVTLRDAKEIRARRAALQALVRARIARL